MTNRVVPFIDLGPLKLKAPLDYYGHFYLDRSDPSARAVDNIFKGHLLHSHRAIAGRSSHSHDHLSRYWMHSIGAWHYDSDDDKGLIRSAWLAIWSNRNPTEVRGPGGEVTQLEPGRLYLINNRRFSHRMPALTRADIRYRVTWRAHLSHEPLHPWKIEEFRRRVANTRIGR